MSCLPHRADPEPWEVRLLGLQPERSLPTMFRAWAVPECNYRGYRGRMAIMEVMRMDADLDELVARRASYREIRNAARAKGFRTLAEDGVRRVIEGSTSLDELARVVDLTERMV